MSRPLRIQFPGAVYHLTSRGNARQPIYLSAEDRQQFCQVLAQALRRYHWRCHAYCLMDNHYHLLIETVDATLAEGMRQLNGLYTQRFNHRHRRVGHVFQGRYQAILVEKDTHLLELARYVVLNPVRARMVKTPAAWPWSSYRAMVGETPMPTWLTTDWLLSQFDSRRAIAQQQYRQFVLEGLTASSPWEHLRGQIYLGSDAFCQGVGLGSPLEEVPHLQQQPVRPSLESLFTNATDRFGAVLTAYRDYRYRLREIAQHLGVHYATVSRWLRAAEEEKVATKSTLNV